MTVHLMDINQAVRVFSIKLDREIKAKQRTTQKDLVRPVQGLIFF